MASEHRAVEQDDGFGAWIRRVAKVVNVAIWAEAADDGGAGWGVNGLALGTNRDFAVVADADAGLLAPDVGPPRALALVSTQVLGWRHRIQGMGWRLRFRIPGCWNVPNH